MQWTKALQNEAKELFVAGKSASQIADVFHRAGHDVSRNGVIGKLHRLGVTRVDQATTARVSTVAQHARERKEAAARREADRLRKAAEREATASAAAPEPPPPPPLARPPLALLQPGPFAVTLCELPARACKFPVGNDSGADQLFCGCERADERYCAPHAQLSATRKAASA